MKIAQRDKDAIIRKITTSLVKAETAKLIDPKELLKELYVAWYKSEIEPYKKSPLYTFFARPDAVNIRITTQLKEFFQSTYNTEVRFNAVTNLKKTDLNIDLIAPVEGRYVSITLTDFLVQKQKIEQYLIEINAAKDRIEVEATRIEVALNTVNTYKQLELQLPVIFNSMPDETKAKYQAYKNKIHTRKTKQEEVTEDFTALGTTLAIQSLKDSVT